MISSPADVSLASIRLPTRPSMVARAMAESTRFLDASALTGRVDPLDRLFDPTFTPVSWDYEHSRVDEIPGKLHAKQLEALHHPARHRWLFWGNQAGKSTLGAIDLALKALGRHPLQKTGRKRMPPWTGWASALTWELWEKILLPELLTWIHPSRILDAPQPFMHSTKRDIVILADNGKVSRITGKAAEQGPQRYQSARVDDIWLDEEHPEAVWNEMQPRLLRHGGDTLATMTPLLGFTWVHGRVYEPVQTGRIESGRHWFSHAGTSHNPSITPEARAEMREELEHNPAQLAAREEGLFVRPHGAVLPWDPEKHLTDDPITPADLNPDTGGRLAHLRLRGEWCGAIDLGKWRFAFEFGVADHESAFTLLDEVFSQNEDADTRAKRIDEALCHWQVPDSIRIVADCADPKGIKELNEALDRRGSKYYIYAVDGALKAKAAGIARFESMLNRGAFKVRRGMGADHRWHIGKSASKPGKLVMGSRWMYEAANWRYPEAPDGKIQKDEPDDTSADGADMMDAGRYLVMTFFPGEPPPVDKKHPTREERIRKEIEALDRQEEEYSPESTEKYGSVLRQ